MKINKHEIWYVLIQLTLRCLKYMKGMFCPNVIWYSYFLIPWQSFYGEKSKIVGEIFSPALETEFVRFY